MKQKASYFYSNYILQSDEGRTDPPRLTERCTSLHFQLNVLPQIWVSLCQAKPQTPLAWHKDGLHGFYCVNLPIPCAPRKARCRRFLFYAEGPQLTCKPASLPS